jgi:hypothetical protein
MTALASLRPRFVSHGVRSRRWVVGGLLAAGLLGVGGGVAMQAQDGAPRQRILEGKVVNKAETPLKDAIVYLKDDHTMAVKSYIADDAGHYRFGQLSQNTDYEVWAESDGKKSGVKTISSFDSKNQFYIVLKVDTAK